MDHDTEIVFDVHGLLRHENRMQADIRVTTLPEGQDPDEVVNQNPDDWKKIIENAAPLVIHVMESLVRSRDINDPKVKNEIAAQMIPLIEDVPNTIERDTYRQRLARLLRVDEDALVGVVKNKKVRRQSQWSTGRSTAEQQQSVTSRIKNYTDPNNEMEKHCLALLTRMPELTYRLDRILQQSDLDRLSEKDFTSTEYMECFLVINRSLVQDGMDPTEFIFDNIPEQVKEELKTLLDSYNPDKINEEDLITDLLRTVIRSRQNKIRENLRQLRFLQEEQQEQEQISTIIPFQEMVITNMQTLHKLDHAILIQQQIK